MTTIANQDAAAAMKEALLSFRTAAMRHTDAMTTCLDAFRAAPVSQRPESYGCNWAWSDRARMVYIREGGVDAFNAASIRVEELDDSPNRRLMHRELYRQRGGVRANLLAVNAFIKSAAGYVSGPLGAGWKRERRAANKALRQAAHAWFQMLETMSFVDALDAQRQVYDQVGDAHGYAAAEFLNALGMNDLIAVASMRDAVEAGEELPWTARARLGFLIARSGDCPDWVTDELAQSCGNAAAEWYEWQQSELRAAAA